jgi:glycosyltransferase involved in cell wall biosynthesis
MRVVILGTRGFPNVQGGLEKHCESLSLNLVKLGCEVVVITRKPYVDTTLREYSGVKLVPLPAFKQKHLENPLHTFLGVFAALRYKPDILHFQAVGSALFIPLAKMLHYKVVFTTHGSNYRHLKWGKVARVVLQISEFLGAKYADQLIAISNNIADELTKRYARSAVVIPNGVDPPLPTESDETLKKCGLSKRKYVLTVGRFVPEKGFHDLVDAFSAARLPHFKLVIVGDADHEDTYSRKLKESTSHNDRIVMPGVLTGEPLREMYTNAALFVLPSYYEGLPISLLEALSYGLSCIATDIPGNRSVDLPDGRYFKPGAVSDLTGLLRTFSVTPVTDTDKVSQIHRICAKYDWRAIAMETLSVYSNCVKSTNP